MVRRGLGKQTGLSMSRTLGLPSSEVERKCGVKGRPQLMNGPDVEADHVKSTDLG
jgi:hypothetical protein